MKINSNNSFKSLTNLAVDGKIYKIFSLKKAEQSGLEGISSLRYVLFTYRLCYNVLFIEHENR